MGWIGAALAVFAVGGLAGSQLYLRLTLPKAARRRSLDGFIIVCATVAALGYGLAAFDCLTASDCRVKPAARSDIKFSVSSAGRTR